MRINRCVTAIALIASLFWAGAQAHVGTHELEHLAQVQAQTSYTVANSGNDECPLCSLAHHAPGCAAPAGYFVEHPSTTTDQTVALFLALEETTTVILPPQRGPPSPVA